MYITEITEDRLSGLSEHIGKALAHMGKVMQCVSELEEDTEAGEETGVRNGRRSLYGQRHHYDYDDYAGRGYGSGRYSRY